MNRESKCTPSRRNFLLAVGAGGVAVAAAAAAVVTGASPQPPASLVNDKTRGESYRLTEHVRNYYRTTQI
jgi:hypothetical protein